ncbi:unnamed protein product [Rotaria socialis]|uniref:Uncharacterized protein n=1 Tax=Rotaria socialis TaxID=392032 RepID=A0A821HHB4_9BILA|nr:unnamed protein product [Rotaria socialis]CAF4682393.1 unnamed protein product [Rotaria socialis]
MLHLPDKITSIEISPCAKWDMRAITAIGTANNLFLLLHIYVDDDNNQPTIYVTLSVESRIEEWRLGASKDVQIGDQCNDCVGLAVDKAKNVYISDTLRSRIIKWSSQTNETTTVAGKIDQSGSTAELLSFPQDLYVTRTGKGNGTGQLNQPVEFTFDSNGNLYVADLSNNRIQLFRLKENNLCSSAVSASIIMHKITSSLLTLWFIVRLI